MPVAFSLWFIRLSIQLAGSIRLFKNPELAPVGVALIYDPATIAQEEIEEAFGGAVETDDSKGNAS